jgi:flagellar export protein FliJ
MNRSSRLKTVLRLARLDETRALQGLGLALREATALQGELSTVERGTLEALDDARPRPSQAEAAFGLQAALERASGLEARAEDLRPRVTEALARFETSRETAVHHQLRTKALERAVARREALRRMERHRRETKQIDDSVRATRQAAEADRA